MELGYWLLIGAGVAATFAFLLSMRGFSSVDTAARTATQAARDAQQLIAQAQPALAIATEPGGAGALADANAQVMAATVDIATGVGEVQAALKEMTGMFAPARAFLAISLLLIIAALISFDLIAVSVSENAEAAAAVMRMGF